MESIGAFLEVVFKRVSPEAVIESISAMDNKKCLICSNRIDRTIFYNEAVKILPQYSEDEIDCIYDYANQLMTQEKEGFEIGTNDFFKLIIFFAKKVLKEEKQTPVCRFDYLLEWRLLTHKLGQDIFTTSYLAYIDTLSKSERSNFTWNPSIHTDDKKLNDILMRGLAENHFHLKGSSHVFSLSWTSLMNSLCNRKKQFEKINAHNKRLDPDQDYGWNTVSADLHHLVLKAALIRVFLYYNLEKDKLQNGMNESEITLFGIFKEDKVFAMIKDNNYLEINLIKIQQAIDVLKSDIYSNDIKFDYIGDRFLNKSYYNDMLTSERKFLYDIFKCIIINERKISKYKDLFYIYLLIKSKLRGELIQVNDRVGFRNFSDYQGRKSEFTEDDLKLRRYVNITAIRASIEEENVKSLEARLIPKMKKRSIIKQINDIDYDIRFSIKQSCLRDRQSCNVCENFRFDYCENLKKQIDAMNDKYFFVVHFPKQKDQLIKRKEKYNIMSFIPRDSKLRHDVKRITLAIMAMREDNNKASKRMLGIDACSNEIGCRPEVFAQAFRYLRDHKVRDKYLYKRLLMDYSPAPQLGLTYHVGEDFLDIADGLRAIDEVILFMNFDKGDRLGHALALGIDVYQWYLFKRNKLVMSKQDLLDNYIWIFQKLKEFGAVDFISLQLKLNENAKRLFIEIYKESEFVRSENQSFDIDEYYDSWKLRGDDPERYKNSHTPNKQFSYWQRCAENPIVDHNLISDKARLLYSAYHFDPHVKLKGSEMDEVKIDNNYIKAIDLIQKKMMMVIGDKGICVETNPSSNYLIGTFKDYTNHPITRFYNAGLYCDEAKIQECPQLSVSINTDDQGVFDTNLGNEYALMAYALMNMLDDDGRRVFKQTFVYDWMEKVRRMGFEQSFKKDSTWS